MKNSLLFVGLDVHAQNITIALAAGDGTAARLHGTNTHDLHTLALVHAKSVATPNILLDRQKGEENLGISNRRYAPLEKDGCKRGVGDKEKEDGVEGLLGGDAVSI